MALLPTTVTTPLVSNGPSLRATIISRCLTMLTGGRLTIPTTVHGSTAYTTTPAGMSNRFCTRQPDGQQLDRSSISMTPRATDSNHNLNGDYVEYTYDALDQLTRVEDWRRRVHPDLRI